MNGRIGTWHRRYRVCGTADHGRADALAAGPVLAAYDDAMRQAAGDGPEVILVREVAADVAIDLAAARPPAEAWGRAMAAAVVRAIATDPGSGNVVRFADGGAHLAAFVAEAADGRPADDWYFERFAACRKSGAAETVRAVLFEHSASAAGAFRCLAASGRLAAILKLIGPIAAEWHWSRGIAGDAPPAEADRPLFAAALKLLDAIAGTVPDRARADSAFAAFLATRTAPADWRDPGSLVDAVADAVRFLVARLGLTWEPEPRAVEDAVLAFDWLDAPQLARSLLERQSTPAVRPRIGLTARQRQWIDALAAVAPRIASDLDRVNLASPANALLALSALTAANPEWSDDPALPGFVRAVLAAAADPRASRLGEGAAPAIRALAGDRSQSSGVPTAAAGAFLLLRAALDLRLPALAGRCGFPVEGHAGARRLMAALAARWVGLALDAEPGLLAFAGIESADEAEGLRTGWSDTGESAVRFQTALAGLLLGRRLMDGGTLRFAIVRNPANGWTAVAGDASLAVWPFAAALDSLEEAGPLLARWAAEWREITGATPTVVLPDSVSPPDGFPSERCEEIPPALAETLATFRISSTGDRRADTALDAIAAAAVRAWATWLKHIGHSTTPYLLDSLIRRPGRLFRKDDELLVELEPRPFDVALQLSGYLDELELPPGGPLRRIRFRIGGAG